MQRRAASLLPSIQQEGIGAARVRCGCPVHDCHLQYLTQRIDSRVSHHLSFSPPYHPAAFSTGVILDSLPWSATSRTDHEGVGAAQPRRRAHPSRWNQGAEEDPDQTASSAGHGQPSPLLHFCGRASADRPRVAVHDPDQRHELRQVSRSRFGEHGWRAHRCGGDQLDPRQLSRCLAQRRAAQDANEANRTLC